MIFDHFGRPELCSVQIPAGAGAWEGTLVVSRPPVPRLDHRFALLLPVQPLGAPADLVRVDRPAVVDVDVVEGLAHIREVLRDLSNRAVLQVLGLLVQA